LQTESSGFTVIYLLPIRDELVIILDRGGRRGNLLVGFFKDMNDSAINLSAYRKFADRPWGRVIGYLVLLVFILGTPVMLSFVYDFNRALKMGINEFSKEAPDFVLKNGELEVAGKMPLVIEDKIVENSVFIIDTSGSTDASVLQNYESGIFISKTQLVNKLNNMETQTFNFSELQGIELTKADVEKLLPYLKLTGFFIILFGLLYFIFAKAVSAVFFGVVCLLFSQIQQAGLTYGQAFKITVYALTIPVLLQALMAILMPGLFYAGVVYYTVLLLYLWFAVKACKDTVDPLNEGPPSV